MLTKRWPHAVAAKGSVLHQRRALVAPIVDEQPLAVGWQSGFRFGPGVPLCCSVPFATLGCKGFALEGSRRAPVPSPQRSSGRCCLVFASARQWRLVLGLQRASFRHGRATRCVVVVRPAHALNHSIALQADAPACSRRWHHAPCSIGTTHRHKALPGFAPDGPLTA